MLRSCHLSAAAGDQEKFCRLCSFWLPKGTTTLVRLCHLKDFLWKRVKEEASSHPHITCHADNVITIGTVDQKLSSSVLGCRREDLWGTTSLSFCPNSSLWTIASNIPDATLHSGLRLATFPTQLFALDYS